MSGRLDKENMIAEVAKELAKMKSNPDQAIITEVAGIYIDAIDKEGFIFDFDKTWRWACYSRNMRAADAK